MHIENIKTSCKVLLLGLGLAVFTANGQGWAANHTAQSDARVSDFSACTITPEKALGIKCPSWQANIFGRIMVDHVAWNRDKANVFADDSSIALRRARFGIQGKYATRWSWKFQYDAKSSAPIKDMYIGYKARGFSWKVGNAKAPFSIDALTSSKYGLFMERSPASLLLMPDRRPGVYGKWNAKDYHFGVAVGLFGSAYKNKNANSFNYTVRAHAAPVYAKGERFVHLGASMVSQSFGNSSDASDHRVLKTSAPFSSAVVGSYIKVDFAADYKSMDTYSLAMAAGYKSFGVTMGYTDVSVKAKNKDKRDGDGSAFYVEGNVWLTGEANAYDPTQGVYKRVKPLRAFSVADGYGAWGVAVRYSQVDMEKIQRNSDNVGLFHAMDSMTFNVTWKPEANVKVRLEYARANCSKTKQGTTACATDQRGDSLSAVQAQLALDF